jgi:apolipoprotein N-acyltransferase
MKKLAAFGRFWWEFVIGDDWLVAVLVAAVVGATAVLAAANIAAWWLLPLAVPVLLWLSLRRAIRSA